MNGTKSVLERSNQLQQAYTDHAQLVTDLQNYALSDCLDKLSTHLALNPSGQQRARIFLNDRATVFRFLRKGKFKLNSSADLLYNTLQWRLKSSLDLLSASSMDPLYAQHPLFFFHPQLKDRQNRPCGVLNLRYLERTEDGTLDSLKEYVAYVWELARRYLADITKQNPDHPALQFVLLLDLNGAGMSNLEIELVPYFLELGRANFPGMIGAVLVLNYGWAYSGMWQIAKRVLPKVALDRIAFPTASELADVFEPQHLLKEHGGTFEFTYSRENPIMDQYGKPTFASPASTPHNLSRQSSFESIQEIFYSTNPSPATSSHSTPILSGRKPSWLNMTSLPELDLDKTPTDASWPDHDYLSDPLASLRDFRLHLPKSDIEHVEDYYKDEESPSDEDGELTPRVSSGNDTTETESHYSSRHTSRQTSRAPSALSSRNPSPAKFSTPGKRTVRFSEPESEPVSRYNSQNPTFGYPAILSRYANTVVPQDTRRRWRDLIRTLIYLLALRFLAANREVQHQIKFTFKLFIRALRQIGLWRRKARTPADESPLRRKSVTFAPVIDKHGRLVHDVSDTSASKRKGDGDLRGFWRPHFILAVLLFMTLRSARATRLYERVGKMIRMKERGSRRTALPSMAGPQMVSNWRNLLGRLR